MPLYASYVTDQVAASNATATEGGGGSNDQYEEMQVGVHAWEVGGLTMQPNRS